MPLPLAAARRPQRERRANSRYEDGVDPDDESALQTAEPMVVAAQKRRASSSLGAAAVFGEPLHVPRRPRSSRSSRQGDLSDEDLHNGVSDGRGGGGDSSDDDFTPQPPPKRRKGGRIGGGRRGRRPSKASVAGADDEAVAELLLGMGDLITARTEGGESLPSSADMEATEAPGGRRRRTAAVRGVSRAVRAAAASDSDFESESSGSGRGSRLAASTPAQLPLVLEPRTAPGATPLGPAAASVQPANDFQEAKPLVLPVGARPQTRGAWSCCSAWRQLEGMTLDRCRRRQVQGQTAATPGDTSLLLQPAWQKRLLHRCRRSGTSAPVAGLGRVPAAVHSRRSCIRPRSRSRSGHSGRRRSRARMPSPALRTATALRWWQASSAARCGCSASQRRPSRDAASVVSVSWAHVHPGFGGNHERVLAAGFLSA